MKKYPEYDKNQQEEWGNLFEKLEYGSFYYNIFDKLYHKGYCYFSKSESVFDEIKETIEKYIPSVPFIVQDVDKLSIEIDIQC